MLTEQYCLPLPFEMEPESLNRIEFGDNEGVKKWE